MSPQNQCWKGLFHWRTLFNTSQKFHTPGTLEGIESLIEIKQVAQIKQLRTDMLPQEGLDIEQLKETHHYKI
jgi:hypothetical protein